MYMNVHIAEVLLTECSARLPEKVTEMQANLDKWKSTEAHAIERATFYWKDLQARSPGSPSNIDKAENMVKGHLKLLEQFDPDNKARTVAIFCLQHFSDLASGVWRTRTPRLYKFMDGLE